MGASVFFQSANELATLDNTFEVDGVATDPTAVTLVVTAPDGTPTTYDYPTGTNVLTKVGTGHYRQDVACSQAGEWQYVWNGTSAASDAVAGSWTVFETTLGHLYATVQALKSRVGLAQSDTVDDYELYLACFAASRSIETACERHFYRTASGTARTFVPDSLWRVKFPAFCDLVTIESLKTDSSGDGTFETTWSASDYQLLPLNPAAAPETRPYTSVEAVGSQTFPLPYCVPARNDRVQVTGTWGWPAIPISIRQAALILAEELFKLKDAPFGVAGFGELGVVRVRENPKVAALIGPYKRNPILVA